MYYAIKFGWINCGDVIFENIAEDIETLNQKVLNNSYDISAISFALYPKIKNEYALLNTAVSFGDGYGPKLIKLKTTKLKQNFTVALSGENTTNALLFKIAYKDAKIIFMNFLDIEKAVIDKKVDAGVLIHESILTYDSKLVVEREIWDIWCELINCEAPLPLGGMAIKRSIPINRAIFYEEVLTKATKIAHFSKTIISKMLLERGLIRVDEDKLSKYLDMYANSNSIALNDKQIDSLNLLYKLGYKHKIYKDEIDIRDYFIPNEYAKIR
jgi:1,4-dihydroxy-6-naphthoate synthase